MPTSIDHKSLPCYAFTDPAGGKQAVKRIRALQAIVVVAIDHLSRIFVIFCWAGRLPTSRYVDKLIRTCELYDPRTFGVEANAMQSLFADLVSDAAHRQLGPYRNRFLAINQPTKVEKNFRIRATLEPVINAGRLFIPSTMTELLADLRGFPTIRQIDRVDCLASAISLIPARIPDQRRHDELDELASYLRETGAPSWYIAKRIEELKGEMT